mmetsp:Transcript_19552/g.1738  ORF Transcript_19552/g.1738 Transcript_19552/m.1738 type:complete len:88 (-) Transcript_19552:160-423(-)
MINFIKFIKFNFIIIMVITKLRSHFFKFKILFLKDFPLLSSQICRILIILKYVIHQIQEIFLKLVEPFILVNIIYYFIFKYPFMLPC